MRKEVYEWRRGNAILKSASLFSPTELEATDRVGGFINDDYGRSGLEPIRRLQDVSRSPSVSTRWAGSRASGAGCVAARPHRARAGGQRRCYWLPAHVADAPARRHHGPRHGYDAPAASDRVGQRVHPYPPPQPLFAAELGAQLLSHRMPRAMALGCDCSGYPQVLEP
jgi:hypothetical protein